MVCHHRPQKYLRIAQTPTLVLSGQSIKLMILQGSFRMATTRDFFWTADGAFVIWHTGGRPFESFGVLVLGDEEALRWQENIANMSDLKLTRKRR
mmetsp:Transcript_3253/g.4478  ORF Transcript_3253/g.4478 Transcript_3253/m.4478 type:complete len:95 (-) Transcript_3253:602-886(-)